MVSKSGQTNCVVSSLEDLFLRKTINGCINLVFGVLRKRSHVGENALPDGVYVMNSIIHRPQNDILDFELRSNC